MGRYILRRLVYSIFVLVGLTLMVFLITHLVGDPARLMLPLEATEEQYQSLRSSLGLDQPLYVQFFHFCLDVAHGDFGDSIWQDVPALPLVISRFPATLYLALATIVFSMAIALPLGIISALNPRSLVDRLTTLISFTGISVPTFWVALMLILIFAVRLKMFKTSGYGGFEFIVLPVLSLSGYVIGRMAQMIRSCMLDEIDKPYVTTARSKGLAEPTILSRHTLRNAAIPIITMTGDQIARLASGAVVIEVVFGWPGVGQLAMEAIERRDFPVVQASVILVALIVIAMNLLVDIVYGWLDPRIRYT